jgi:hypothetical protein
LENTNGKEIPAGAASETINTGYNSTITVELNNTSKEVNIGVAQDSKVMEYKEAIGDSLAQLASIPYKLTDQEFKVILRRVNKFPRPINNINTPSKLISTALNKLTESEVLIKSERLAKADLKSKGDSLEGLHNLTLNINGDPDTLKRFDYRILAVIKFNVTIPLKFDKPGQVTVYRLGDKLESLTGLNKDMAEFNLIDLNITEQKVINHKRAGKRNEFLKAADTLYIISQHNP